MIQNPLIAPVLAIIQQSDQNLSEYEIIKQLEQSGVTFPVASDSYEVALFKKHFLTMNALYQLQRKLYHEGYYLAIDAMAISLRSLPEVSAASLPAKDGEDRIRDYYLDWKNFDSTGQEEVEKLLRGFWDKYFAVDKQAQALTTLGLDEHSSWEQVQTRYRQLANAHHPDKGGKHSRFIEIQDAFEALRCCYK